MSVNSSPVAQTTISQWLARATRELQSASIESARLDALVLLCDELKWDKSRALAYPEQLLTPDQKQELDAKVDRRKKHEPLAYIRGFCEFYGRDFIVTPDVLIPRPETEVLIDLIKSLPALNHETNNSPFLIDVGTGSGCIGLTARLEIPNFRVLLTDIDSSALEIARQNASRLRVEHVEFQQNNLLVNLTSSQPVHIIAANLPYVAADFSISPDAHHEPSLALFAEDEGHALIEQLLPQAASALVTDGYLLLESDPWQQDRIEKSATGHGFKTIARERFHLVLQKSVR